MEKALEKLAAQLNSFDEHSLSVLWERYANLTARFEPTRRWEESVLIFCMIQAMRWKNQLFNFNMVQSSRPVKGYAGPDADAANFLFDLAELGNVPPESPESEEGKDAAQAASAPGQRGAQGCKILTLRLDNPGKG